MMTVLLPGLVRRERLSVLALLLVLRATLVQSQSNVPPDMVNAQVGRKPMRLPKSEPYIACAVCQEASERVWDQVEVTAKNAPYGKIGEIEIGNIIKDTCDPDDDLGEWMPFLDLKQESPGAPITFEKQEYIGECRRECMTLVHACRKVFDEHIEDMSELLYKRYEALRHKESSSLDKEKFVSRVCKKWSKSCPGKTMPEGFAHKDEYWIPADEESYRMRRMQHSINKAAGSQSATPVQFLDPMGPQAMFGMGDEDL
mmetsp:Transcript_55057/g.131201  ORF Transcript_55057/g.131201 Transcript_55057/m.131201 type:complete len:257 (+) Transcript_55057:142-912(+)